MTHPSGGLAGAAPPAAACPPGPPGTCAQSPPSPVPHEHTLRYNGGVPRVAPQPSAAAGRCACVRAHAWVWARLTARTGPRCRGVLCTKRPTLGCMHACIHGSCICTTALINDTRHCATPLATVCPWHAAHTYRRPGSYSTLRAHAHEARAHRNGPPLWAAHAERPPVHLNAPAHEHRCACHTWVCVWCGVRGRSGRQGVQW